MIASSTRNGALVRILNIPFIDVLVNEIPGWIVNRFDEYFKDIYRYGILCKNNIYSLEEYRQKLESVLEELLAAPITREEFFRTLNAMNHYHLITQDYVMKYTKKYVIKNNETN